MQLHAAAPLEPEDPSPVAARAGDGAEVEALRAEVDRERRRREEMETVVDLVLDAVSDAVVLVGENGTVARVNRAAIRLGGKTADDLAGHTVHTVFADDVAATRRHPPDRSADGGEEELDGTPAPATGRPRGPRVSCSVLRDGAGRVVGGVYSADDRTEEQHLADRLGEAEERWRLLAELGDLLGREVDPLETLPQACRWLARATGTSVAVIIVMGTTVQQVIAWPPDDPTVARLSAMRGRLLEPGSALWITVRHSRTLRLPVVQSTTPLLGAEGAPAGVRSATLVPLVARNSSLGALLVHASRPGGVPGRLSTVLEEAAARVALALANDQLRETLSQLKAAQEVGRDREELLAAASHDMQTPLAVLLGTVQALQGGTSLSPVQRALLYERMARRGAQLRRLVQQFLDYSRLEAGRPIVVRPALSDLGAAISSVEAVVAGRCSLEFDMPDGLPPAFVDLDRLEQVLGNLASNAVKFSPEGSTISVTARSTLDSVDIEVADRGQGMTADDLARAFEKFHRGSGAEGTQGSGLGLYMSRALVEAMGGRLEAESTPGEGSRFTVVLPRWPAQDGPQTGPPSGS